MADFMRGADIPSAGSVPSSLPASAYLRAAKQHAVQFFESDAYLVSMLLELASEGLDRGEAILILARADHLAELERALRARREDAATAVARGQLVLRDATEMLSLLLDGQRIDGIRFGEIIGGTVAELSGRFPAIRAYGEMVDILWDRGQYEATLALETAWDALQADCPFSLVCGYSMKGFRRGETAAPFREICDAHSEVRPAEDYLALRDGASQARAITLLQQRAKSLEWEIEERKKIESELRHKAWELTRSNEELQRYMYAASHDLKEPIRAVAGFLQLLERRAGKSLEGECAEFVKHAVDGALRMNALIDALLAHARVGRHEPARPVDSGACFDEAVENLSDLIRSSHATVSRGELPQVIADEVRLTQLWQNLLSNALKFHSGAPPVVRAEGALSEDGKTCSLSLSDRGIGIAKAHHQRIFVLFNRLHSRERYPGSGVGLATCKKIVESFGGRIWVESAPREGATFHFTLPAAH